MMEKSFKILAALLAAACLCGCSLLLRNGDSLSDGDGSGAKPKMQSVISTGSEQLALIYNPNGTTIHPKVFARKSGMGDVDLYVMINDGELLSKASASKQGGSASVRIFYKIMESYENTALVDSSLRVVQIKKGEAPRSYAIKLRLKPVELEKFVVQTTVTDMVRGKMSIHFSEVDKADHFSADNFMVTSASDLQPYAYSFATLGDDLRVSCQNSGVPDTIYYGTRPPEPQVTLSPYASDPAVEDTSHFFNIEPCGRNVGLKPEKRGLYAFTADTSWSRGLTIACFGSDYPNISTPEDMIKPLAYLCTPEEYAQIASQKTKKLAVDEFWYQNSGDLRKAKEQIRIYYTRAIYANIYFSDYREGCLTDRGMLYTVLGPPKTLAITSDGEVWGYRDSRNGQSVKFTFRKVKSRLCGSKYVLRRSTEYKPYWDKAVSTWRKGNVFSF